ncbi:MAG: ABC transporter ATP-binding protein [Spirochaetales bacterium]|nr:ABC transporter ATP-binding protein [Spirochaetales bacterium]
MQNVVILENVVKRFKKITAVDNLCLQVHRGEIFGLLGPNGAGKTTTINLIIGLLKITDGHIDVLGFNPDKQAKEIRKHIGLVPQETNVYEDLNAMDNLQHHAALYCHDLRGLKKQIQEKLKLMDLWDRSREPVRNFSGGMKRRLALARTLLHDPEIIFFDEPTLGVDVQVRHNLWNHIKQQRARGKTFIISTNNMDEADQLCDRLLIMDNGKQIVEGSPLELKDNFGKDIITIKTNPVIIDTGDVLKHFKPDNIVQTNDGYTRFEIENGEELAGELVQTIKISYKLESIQIAKPSLDDVFLHFTGRALRE